jgi:hypothetical protein
MRRSPGLLLVALLALVAAVLPALAGGDVRDRTKAPVITVGTPRSARVLPAAKAVPPPLAPPGAPPPVAPPVHGGLGYDPVARVRQYSGNLADVIDRGDVRALYTGLGQVAGEMVEMKLTNVSSRPITLDFVPGMVLAAPADSKVQPLLTEEEYSLTLQPQETISRPLICYCLDYSLDPPGKGQTVAFVFAKDPERYADAIRVLYAGLQLDETSHYHPMLAPLQHRRIVIQRAIWAVLDQKPASTAHDKDVLKKDIKEDAARAGRSLASRQVDKLTDTIWKDVNQTLEKAKTP